MATIALDGAYETPAQMIAAIQAHRERQAALEREEERVAAEAAKSDPAVRAWVQAAIAENAGAN